MTEQLPRLGNATPAPVSRAAAQVPAPGMLHLGLGNFHRAHQAVYTDAAITAAGGDWGIVGASSRSASVVDAMLAQDLLYTVVEISPEGSRFTVPRVHTDAFVAADDPRRVVSTIADPATRIVSLTVTEHGYTYSPSTSTLNLADPLVAADLAGGPGTAPVTVIGQLARGIQLRMLSGADPVTILSCDNLAGNGHHTRRLVEEFASRLPSSEAAELLGFLGSHVTFPSSMVDRIVPSTTEHYRSLVAAKLGYTDTIPVPAEPFTMWIIEDDFAAGRPAWEAGGAIFSNEVAEYEQLKVRLLNGTHSLLAYVGALSGAAIIPEATNTDFIEAAARAVLREEYLPSVAVPSTVDVDDYEEQLFSRWRNTALGHRTSQVGSDGSVKIAQRIPEPAIEMLRAGTMPQFLALTTAAYLCCIAPLPGFDPGVHAAAMVDPARATFAGYAASSADGHDLARRVLAEHHLLGDELANEQGFIDRVGDYIDIITRHGVRAAVAEATTHTRALGSIR